MIIFVHLPKTGGNSFLDILTQSFDGKIGYDYVLNDTAWIKGDRKEFHHDDVCIAGHFKADRYIIKYPKAKLITFVRDPVERVISMYYHRMRDTRTHPNLSKLGKSIKKDLSLEEFIEIKYLHNRQSQFIDPEKISSFYFVGLTERYEESIRLFKKIFNISKKLDIKILNSNPDKAKNNYMISEKLRKKIREYNRKDIVLYESAKKRFWELKANFF